MSLKDRIREHLGYVRNKNKKQAKGINFKLPGHSRDNLKVTVLEKVLSTDPLYRREREAFHIMRNTCYYGLTWTP